MKTYCISDIHGHLSNLKRFVKTLNNDDKVYVLGDVVDKGDKSIECLKLIMEDSRFKMLLGNHEYMMFQLLSIDKTDNNWQDEYEHWVIWNCGENTLDSFESLEKFEQVRIYNYLKSLPLNMPNVKVGERLFYLVHSCPQGFTKLKMPDVNFDDDEISSYVWERVNPLDFFEPNGQIVIAGHTMVQEYLGLNAKQILPIYDRKNIVGNKEYDLCKAHYIDIDGGLASGLPNSRLIVLCLDDLSYKLY